MGGVTTGELVLLALFEVEREVGGCTLSELATELSLSSGRLSGRIELASALEALDDRGLVAIHLAEDGADDRVRFVLTEEGRGRAETVRERLAGATVEVVDDGREELALAAAAERFGRSMVEIAANRTDDGVYYPREYSPSEFVDRSDALSRCLALLERPREGSGRAIFLVGPAGAGKTTLAEEAVELADLPVLHGRCHGEGTAPYQPLRDALAATPGESPFADAGPGAEDRETYRAQRKALFGAITDRLVADGPRLLSLDDLHLADAGTESYLAYLLDRLSELPLALVGSYRPAELSGDVPFERNAAPPDAPVEHVDVGPLDRPGTRALIERVIGRPGVPDAFVDAVSERTGGNPLFVEETVTALIESGNLDPQLEWFPERTDEIPMPSKVRETIDRRVSQFPTPARELLQWAGVLGDRTSEAVLAAVSGTSATRFGTYLDLLVDAGVLERGDRGTLQFGSDVVREALLERLPDGQRRNRHATAASALESHRTGDEPRRAGTIAPHHDWAGNAERAGEWYRRAGERATDVYANDVAIEYYQRALGLAREVDDREALLEVIEGLSEIYVAIGEYDAARRHVDYARERVEDPRRRQRLLHLASRISTERGDFEGAIDLAEEGLALDGEALRIRWKLLEGKAVALLERRATDRAGETAARMLSTAADLDDPRLEASASAVLGTVEQHRADYETAREHYRRALDGYREVDDRHGVGESLISLGELALRRADHEVAEDYLDRAAGTFHEVEDRHGVAKAQDSLGELALQRTEYDRARDALQRALDGYREVGDRHGRATCLVRFGRLALETGDPETARERGERALSILEELSAIDDALSALELLVECAEADDDSEVALARCRQGLVLLSDSDGIHEGRRQWFETRLEEWTTP